MSGISPASKKSRKSAEQLQSHCQQYKHFTSQDLLSLVLMMSFLIPTTVTLNIQADFYGFTYWVKGSNMQLFFHLALTSILTPK